MTETTRLNEKKRSGSLAASLKKILKKVAIYIPALIIFGLIALYYIQLSHMA